MGVLECDRRGCQNVMCDHFSHRYGYLCDECLDELRRRGPATDIEQFMGTAADRRWSDDQMSLWGKLLEDEFRDRRSLS